MTTSPGGGNEQVLGIPSKETKSGMVYRAHSLLPCLLNQQEKDTHNTSILVASASYFEPAPWFFRPLEV